MHEIEDWVDVSGGEGGLVAVAVEAVVNVSGAGHDAAAAAAGNVAVVARCAVLGIGAVPAWVVHELALAAVANVCGVVWVVAVAAAVVGDAGDIGVGDVECVAAAATEVAGAVAVAVRCLVFDVAVGVVVGGLCLWLRYQVRIVVPYA